MKQAGGVPRRVKYGLYTVGEREAWTIELRDRIGVGTRRGGLCLGCCRRLRTRGVIYILYKVRGTISATFFSKSEEYSKVSVALALFYTCRKKKEMKTARRSARDLRVWVEGDGHEWGNCIIAYVWL